MATELWHPDIEVTEQLVQTSIEEQFPELTPIINIQCIGEGWDNKVFLINEKIIFRFPHRKIATSLIVRENEILKNIHDRFRLEIPEPIYIGHSSSYYPHSFQGYPIIQGTASYQASLSLDERQASIIPLATFLKNLHNIIEKEALYLGAKPQVFDRTNIDEMIASLSERVTKIIARKIVKIDMNCFEHEVKVVKKITLPLNDKVLVHGDLHCRHLMFNQGLLTGIIDWGDVGINHRAVDLAIIFSFYPASCHQDFFNIYGNVEPQTWQYARFLGLYSALSLMLYGHDVGDQLLVTETINSIRRINAGVLGESTKESIVDLLATPPADIDFEPPKLNKKIYRSGEP